MLAPDLYAGKGVAQTIEEAKVLQPTANGDETYQTITAASSYLLGHNATSSKSIGVVGYSMGAYWALLLEGPVSVVVAFYGLSDLDSVTTNAAIIGHFAEQDEFEPVETVRPFEAGLRERGKKVEFYIYPDTHHWFFEADRPEYDAEAAQLAWERTIAFLRQHIQ